MVEIPQVLVRGGKFVESDPEFPSNGKHFCVHEDMQDIESIVSKAQTSANESNKNATTNKASVNDPRRVVADFGPANIRMEKDVKTLIWKSRKFDNHILKFVYKGGTFRSGNQKTEYYSCVDCLKVNAEIEGKTGRSVKVATINVIGCRIVSMDPDFPNNVPHLCLLDQSTRMDRDKLASTETSSHDFGAIRHCHEKGYENWVEFDSRKFKGHTFRFIPSGQHTFEDRKIAFYDCQACRKIQRANENFKLPYKNIPRVIVQNSRFLDLDPDSPVSPHICVKVDPKLRNGYKVIETPDRTEDSIETFGEVEVKIMGQQKLQVVYYQSRANLTHSFIFVFNYRKKTRHGDFLDYFKCLNCLKLNEKKYKRSREVPLITISNNQIVRTDPDNPPNAKHFCVKEKNFTPELSFDSDDEEEITPAHVRTENKINLEMPACAVFIEPIPESLLRLTRPVTRDLQALWEKQEAARKKRKALLDDIFTSTPNEDDGVSIAETPSPTKSYPMVPKKRKIIEDDEDEPMQITRPPIEESTISKTNKDLQSSPRQQKVKKKTKRVIIESEEEEEDAPLTSKEQPKSLVESSRDLPTKANNDAEKVTPSQIVIPEEGEKPMAKASVEISFGHSNMIEEEASQTIHYTAHASDKFQCKPVVGETGETPEREFNDLQVGENIQQNLENIVPSICPEEAIIVIEETPIADSQPTSNVNDDVIVLDDCDEPEKPDNAIISTVDASQQNCSDFTLIQQLLEPSHGTGMRSANNVDKRGVPSLMTVGPAFQFHGHQANPSSAEMPIIRSSTHISTHNSYDHQMPSSSNQVIPAQFLNIPQDVVNSGSNLAPVSQSRFTVPPSSHINYNSNAHFSTTSNPALINALNSTPVFNLTPMTSNPQNAPLFPTPPPTIQAHAPRKHFALVVKHTYLTTQRQFPMTNTSASAVPVETPHADVVVPYKSPYNPLEALSDDERMTIVGVVYKHIHDESVTFNSNPHYQHLFLVDSLFFAFNHAALSNTCMLRTEFPALFEWSSKFLNNFRFINKPSSYIFYAIGFDLLVYFKYNSLETVLQMVKGDLDFLLDFFSQFERLGRQPDAWFINRKFTIIFITIPELGNYKTRLEQFNLYMRKAIMDYQAK
uniref:Uncharacterized protein n=1 Tax=Acrobeloides nanus TaxID=290746 RepID=A0A914C3D7_9BILA